MQKAAGFDLPLFFCPSAGRAGTGASKAALAFFACAGYADGEDHRKDGGDGLRTH